MVKAKAKSKTENVADLSAKLGQMMNESAQQDSSDPAPAPEKKSASRSNFKGELLIPAPQGGVLSVIPIKTYVAVDEDKVERHMYHSADCRNSLNYGAMTCSGCGTVVDKNSAVKGVEVDGKIILVSDDDLKSQQPMRDGKMKILEYVNETDINPIYYEDAEFVVPDATKASPIMAVFATLVEALKRTGKVAKGVRVEGGRAPSMPRPRIEIFHFEIPYPQAYIDHISGQASVGGTPGEVKVRLAWNHGIWEASTDLRTALKQLMKSCKIFGHPHRIDAYDVVFSDTVRCDAFDAEGREYQRPQAEPF
jgi:hypothetical protein